MFNGIRHACHSGKTVVEAIQKELVGSSHVQVELLSARDAKDF
jgi:hypothetical protein